MPPDPFDATTIGPLSLANRFVRAATWEGLADDDGRVTPELTEVYVRLAKGGVGLILTGHAYVSPEGQAGPRQLAVHDDSLTPGLSEMVEAVHAAGGKIAVQLAHAGGRAPVRLTGLAPLAPSADSPYFETQVQAMTRAQIEAIAAAFGRAAERAKQAGFDGVEIHAAHGYLLSEFLSPAFNRRSDDYGGDAANRARFLLEVVAAVREAVGPDLAVMVKINSQDYLDGGLSSEECLEVGRLLEAAGVDAVEMSGGTFASGKLLPSRVGRIGPEEEGYFRETARAFKRSMATPLILVGGIRTLDGARRLLAEGACDLLSLCRPLIREPELIERWRSGEETGSSCESDNLCFRPIIAGKGFYCELSRRQAKKD